MHSGGTGRVVRPTAAAVPSILRAAGMRPVRARLALWPVWTKRRCHSIVQKSPTRQRRVCVRGAKWATDANGAAGHDHANATAYAFRNRTDSASGEPPRFSDLLCPFLCPLSTNHHIVRYRSGPVRLELNKASKPHVASAFMHTECYQVIPLILAVQRSVHN